MEGGGGGGGGGGYGCMKYATDLNYACVFSVMRYIYTYAQFKWFCEIISNIYSRFSNKHLINSVMSKVHHFNNTLKQSEITVPQIHASLYEYILLFILLYCKKKI